MSYGQQPSDGNRWNQPNVPPVPPVPQAPSAGPYGAQGDAPGTGYGAQPTAPQHGAGYGAPQQPNAPQYGTGYGAPTYGQYGAVGAPWGALPMSRPGTVTAGSILAFIGGGFMVVVGLILAIAGSAAGLQDAVADEFGAEFGTVIAVVGVVFLVIGGLVVFFGVMAFKGRRWGAIALAVLAGLSVIGGIGDLTGSSGGGSSLFGVVWSVTGAVLLLVSSSQAWYRAKS